MELTNEQRKYLGLELIEPAWDRMEISNSIHPEHESGKVILYFDGDIIRKTISIHCSGSYEENSVYLKTLEVSIANSGKVIFSGLKRRIPTHHIGHKMVCTICEIRYMRMN